MKEKYVLTKREDFVRGYYGGEKKRSRVWISGPGIRKGQYYDVALGLANVLSASLAKL